MLEYAIASELEITKVTQWERVQASGVFYWKAGKTKVHFRLHGEEYLYFEEEQDGLSYARLIEKRHKLMIAHDWEPFGRSKRIIKPYISTPNNFISTKENFLEILVSRGFMKDQYYDYDYSDTLECGCCACCGCSCDYYDSGDGWADDDWDV